MLERLTLLLASIVLALAPAAPAAAPTSTTLVFVPYEKATGPKLGPGQAVLLPYAEFLRLRGTAAGTPGSAQFTPVASLAQAVYDGTVEGDVARLDAQLTIEALARPTDRLEVRLPFQSAAVESAVIEGPKASLAPLEGETGFRIYLTGEGRRTLRLKLAVPLATVGAAAQAGLPGAARGGGGADAQDPRRRVAGTRAGGPAGDGGTGRQRRLADPGLGGLERPPAAGLQAAGAGHRRGGAGASGHR